MKSPEMFSSFGFTCHVVAARRRIIPLSLNIRHSLRVWRDCLTEEKLLQPVRGNFSTQRAAWTPAFLPLPETRDLGGSH